MKIAIVTDAWSPQINGVVRTLKTTVAHLKSRGHQVAVFSPSDFRNFPLPGYPEIRMAWLPACKLGKMLDAFDADAIHISTEGTIGSAARHYCLKHGLRFSSAYHTRFPEYLRLRLPVPLSWSYRYMRRFHNAANVTMVATASLEQELRVRGFTGLKRWSRGVDIDLFRIRDKDRLNGPRPVAVYLGRVAVEKNIHAYLDLDVPVTKYVIGDGPALNEMKKRYPKVRFLGYKTGEDLAIHLGSADVMVFPSLTDTFGLVLLESMACGVPVAAYPVTGPLDVVKDGVNGWLDGDLAHAVEQALMVSPASCRNYAQQYSWENAVDQFEANLVPVNGRLDEALDLETQPG